MQILAILPSINAKVDDDTISDNDSRLQLDEDNNSEEDTESQIPSSIQRKRNSFYKTLNT